MYIQEQVASTVLSYKPTLGSSTHIGSGATCVPGDTIFSPSADTYKWHNHRMAYKL